MGSTKMDFIIIFEKNYKDREHITHYCQWTGNEVELAKLFAVIRQGVKIYTEIQRTEYDDFGGDYTQFWCSGVKIPESAVNVHRMIGSDFRKNTGTFVCPEFGKEPFEPLEIAKQLHNLFYDGRIKDCFKKE